MAALQPLKFLTVSPLSKHTATVIFLHGLGDTGHGWKPVADMLKKDSALKHIKWVLPHASKMSVTANMGMEMPSWFDILGWNLDGVEDKTGLLRAEHLVNQLITAEIDAGIPANRIVLGGFSQGGALTTLTGLTNERKLGGLVVLSGWVPLNKTFTAMFSPETKSVPLFWGHGRDDPVVPFVLGVRSIEFIKSNLHIPEATPNAPQNGGYSFHAYDGLTHSTNPQELGDLAEWLTKVIPQE